MVGVVCAGAGSISRVSSRHSRDINAPKRRRRKRQTAVTAKSIWRSLELDLKALSVELKRIKNIMINKPVKAVAVLPKIKKPINITNPQIHGFSGSFLELSLNMLKSPAIWLDYIAGYKRCQPQRRRTNQTAGMADDGQACGSLLILNPGKNGIIDKGVIVEYGELTMYSIQGTR